MSRIVLEVACANPASVQAAIQGGADRIELCAALGIGGLTPSEGFIRETLRLSSIPVFVMIRPREGDFLYTDEEFEVMLRDVDRCRALGVPGIVTGMLTPDGVVDRSRADLLIERAGTMQVTFHRAFDMSADASAALNEIIAAGFSRLLTSGMCAAAPEGADVIRKTVEQADRRIAVMAGAGVRPDNVADLVRSTGVREVHLSGKVVRPGGMVFRRTSLSMGTPESDEYSLPVTDLDVIRSVRSALDLL